MIELVVTMIIVGILAVVVLPKFGALDEFDTHGYTNQLKSVFRYGQKTAVAQRRQTIVGYSRAAVTICSEPHSDTPANCPLSFAAVDCSSGGRSAVPTPGGNFRPGPASVTHPGGAVCFNARGEAYVSSVVDSVAIDLDGVAPAEINIVTATGYVR